MTSERVMQMARDLGDRLAGEHLRREEARLYSQHSRLRNRQPSLTSWNAGEASARLNDAICLVDAGNILRDNNDERWRACFTRCGEILEWLAHPSMQLIDVPSQLLSAAAYHIAGYPARADALLRELADERYSKLISSFLRGHLSDALAAARLFWKQHLEPTELTVSQRQQDVSAWVVIEVVRALGVVCAALRWPGEARQHQAIDRLRDISLVHASGVDRYSWLLAKLVAEASRECSEHGWRTVLQPLSDRLSANGRNAIDRYCRLAFANARARAWPSQEEGIRRLVSERSFALCTPTGSGKTSVAEIALIDSIFEGHSPRDPFEPAPLGLYLVPSRALAAEVEGKLTRVLRHISDQRIVVTGLYGGTDWGPADAWLTSDEPTVLICTYEKAEALFRFLGPLIVPRLTLVIFDEAHTVQFDGNINSLRDAENRSFRLESLGLRISQLVDREKCRVIALSAVAAGLEDSLHRWVSASESGTAVKVPYRSTRQLIGRLVVTPAGRFSIHYDILDGKSLRFTNDSEATPFVPDPIPACPPVAGDWAGPEKSLRPAVLWAALHFSAPDDLGYRHAVLISITQKISGYAKDFLDLLQQWEATDCPRPSTGLTADQQHALQETLEVCADYFGVQSYEYRLLKRGIAVHHASMPKVLGRRIIDLVQSQTTPIVLATSTLSEGINVPVETILVPTLNRYGRPISTVEFRNLAGRAGRPGVASEGRTLVVLPPVVRAKRDLANRRYDELVSDILRPSAERPRSPLAEAISDLWHQWQLLTVSNDFDRFLGWLEQVNIQQVPPDRRSRLLSLDAVDSVLLAGIVENDELSSGAAWEDRLHTLWNASFASHLASDEHRQAFVRRGSVIPSVYPDRASRRRIYRTGLPPSTAFELFDRFPAIQTVLSEGADYAKWPLRERFCYITEVINALGSIGRFTIPDGQDEWRPILQWWLWRQSVPAPAANKIADWHKNVSTWFTYRISWGLGSVIGYAFERISEGVLTATSLDAWEATGLPWIVFWLKELFAWGTLDPAAAFVLASGIASTRPGADAVAADYYGSAFSQERGDPLDPRSIRDWAQSLGPADAIPQASPEVSRTYPVTVTDPTVRNMTRHFRVFPVDAGGIVTWIDPAGYPLAQSPNASLKIDDAENDRLDFILRPKEALVVRYDYL